MARFSFALEDIEESNEVVVAEPTGFAMMDTPREVSVMENCDKRSTRLVSKIGSSQEAVASLEAMANQLKHSTAASLGKLGVRFANIAIEQFCAGAQYALEELPLDPRRYESDPQAATTGGVEKIGEAKAELNKGVGTDMVSILYGLTEKRNAFNRIIHQQYHRIDEVQEALDRFKDKEGVKPSTVDLPVSGNYYEFFYVDGGAVALGSTVVSDISHLLTEHTHLFKRLIKKNLDWLNEHKDNILKTPAGFDQYSFNPVEYNISGSDVVEKSTESTVVYKGPALPGGKNLYCKTVANTRFGYDAIDALTHSSAYIDATTPIEPGVEKLAVLNLSEIQARLEELKHGLENIRHWCDMAYCKMWKDAFFEETILTFLMKDEAEGLSERGLSMLAYAILSLLNNATTDVAQYALTSFDALLNYVEDSVRAYGGET